jgi:hypothetical protein
LSATRLGKWKDSSDTTAAGLQQLSQQQPETEGGGSRLVALVWVWLSLFVGSLFPLHTGNRHGGVWNRGVRIEWDQQQRDGQAMKSGFRKLGISMDIPCIYHVNTSINIPCIYLDIPCIYLVDIHCDWHPSHDHDRANLISKTHLVCNLSLSKMQHQSRRLK